jgi:hypothetical protein
MKKWVFGCLGLFLIVAAGGGYVVYRFVYLPGKAYVQSYTQLKVVPELNAQITNKSTYTPPANRALTNASIEQLVRAQRAMRTRLGERIQELETKYKFLGEQYQAKQKEPSLPELMSALKDLTGLYVDAKKAQVDALNEQGLSLAEYEWTRARAYEALGLPIATTLQQVISDISAGRTPDVEAITNAPPVEVPEENRNTVKPFTEELTQGAALAFFAL